MEINYINMCFGSGEIFYLITQRYYSFDISIKVNSRTLLAMKAEDAPLNSGILMGTHKLRYLMLLQGYLLSLTRFYEKDEKFFTDTCTIHAINWKNNLFLFQIF